MTGCTCFSASWCGHHMRVSFWPERFAAWEREYRDRRAAMTAEERIERLERIFDTPLRMLVVSS